MYPSLQKYCDNLVASFDEISEDRKKLLLSITAYIQKKQKSNQSINLVYICTHNSRRSHFGQIWAHVAAHYYSVKNVNTYSGGTEVTAFNTNAINALKRIGFVVKSNGTDKNPIYQVFHTEQNLPSICFSKTFDDKHNPQSNFAAIMTCSDAEENCPFVSGQDIRIGTTYDDPKVFDNTPQQNLKYDERCRQIALETFFAFSKL